MTVTLLRRIDPTRNMARSYELSVQPGLFGDIALTRHWGRIGTVGQTKEYWFESEDAAIFEAKAILKQKHKRGYVLCS